MCDHYCTVQGQSSSSHPGDNLFLLSHGQSPLPGSCGNTWAVTNSWTAELNSDYKLFTVMSNSSPLWAFLPYKERFDQMWKNKTGTPVCVDTCGNITWLTIKSNKIKLIKWSNPKEADWIIISLWHTKMSLSNLEDIICDRTKCYFLSGIKEANSWFLDPSLLPGGSSPPGVNQF